MNKRRFLFLSLIVILLILSILNLSVGEYDISFKNSILAVFSVGNEQDVNFILNVRLPRTIVAIIVGSTLSVSGYYMRYALKNPLADSSILGIQSGATTLNLIMVLYFPLAYYIRPLIAFVGGLIAFSLTILVTKKEKISSSTLILSGVIVNAFFTSIIGVLSILNPRKLQSALMYLNGSLVSITLNDSIFILIVGVILLLLSFYLIPILKILLLDDINISNLGLSPIKYRIIAAIFSILLASITVSFVGVISFIGIIIPSISKKIINGNIQEEILLSILLGANLVLLSDFMQRIIFAPMEIPVGLVIGLICTPLFLLILRRNYGV